MIIGYYSIAMAMGIGMATGIADILSPHPLTVKVAAVAVVPSVVLVPMLLRRYGSG